MAIPFQQGADQIRHTNGPIDLGDDFFAVKAAQNARNKLRGFSKAWDVGSQLEVFYPFRLVNTPDDPDRTMWVPCLSVVYGHKCDNKIFKRSFLRSRCELDADMNIVGEGDLPYQFSRIATVLVHAMKEKELDALANKDWSLLGQSAYASARQEVEDKYDPKKLNGVKPIIQRFTLQRNTVCYAVAMDNGQPKMQTSETDKSKTGLFTHTLSEDRMGKLVGLANDPLMGINAQHSDKTYTIGDVSYLEVMYNFTSARMEKSEAGRADAQGVAASITLTTRFPDLKPQIEAALSQIPTSSDDIRRKLYAMEPMDDNDLIRALQSYTFSTAGDWGYLPPEEQERLLGASNLVDFLRVVPSDEKLKAKFAEKLGHPIGQGTPETAPTIESLGVKEEEFDVTKQQAAVQTAIDKTAAGEQFSIPAAEGTGDDDDLPFKVGDDGDSFAGTLEV